MSGEVPEFDVSRILFLVSLRQSENNECFLNGKKMEFFFLKSYQTIQRPDEDFTMYS